MNPVWLLRMAKWARHRPSPKKFYALLVVLGLVGVVVLVEWLGLWPDWATSEALPGRRGMGIRLPSQ